MIYEKRYLQFNELVFDGYDMISDYSEPVSYKGNSQPYSFGHGAYRPLKANYLFVNERQVSMTLTLKTKKVPCEYRQFYVRFAEQELGKPGRLWAIKNNEIIWAYASATNIRPIANNRKDEVTYDIEFVIPGGVWHKADKLKTFVLPYDPCLFMECKKFRSIDPCAEKKTSGDCCLDCVNAKTMREAEKREDCGCCCDEQLCNDMALCFHTDELQAFYGCDTPYQLVYSCEKAELYNDGEPLGQKLCTKDACSNIIAGRFYSETDIPTRGIGITLIGKLSNPSISINGNENYIKGEYDGLRIDADGSVYAHSECCDTLLPASVWGVPHGMDYGWTIYPQENRVIIDTGLCCGKSCIYIREDAITA